MERLQELVGAENIFWNEPMKNRTTFRAGGPARCLVEPESLEQLQEVLEYVRAEKIPFYIIGNGSNLLVSDEGYDGVIIQLFKKLSKIRISDDRMLLEAGVLLVRAANMARKEGLAGLEFASGIPGTIGGAMVMNAGAYGGEMKDVVERVRVVTSDGQIRDYTGEEMAFGYRTSRITAEGSVVVEVELKLHKDDPAQIQARMDELKAKRLEKQPLEFASAGSTFKRPEGYFAGKLIQDAGLRGFSIGDAQVSEKHCGFVINRGGASASQIAQLIREVQRRVYENSGVQLETEVRFLGHFK
jgi:UDP-N-acetylmuramate dehydrogenase